MRIDLHLHTRGSWDCLSDPDVLLDLAIKRGLDRIAITDHNELGVALDMARRHPDRIVPGEEVKTAEGIDIIGLYLSSRIPKGTGAVETCERIRDQGGLVYLPHPYARGKGGSGALADSLAPLVDVVEVFNARLRSRERNERGAALASRHDLLRAAGSDAHTYGEIGNAWVELPRHRNRPEELRDALHEGSIQGRAASPRAFVHSNLAKLWKRLPGTRSRELGDPETRTDIG